MGTEVPRWGDKDALEPHSGAGCTVQGMHEIWLMVHVTWCVFCSRYLYWEQSLPWGKSLSPRSALMPRGLVSPLSLNRARAVQLRRQRT